MLDLVLDQYSDAIHSTTKRWKFFNIYTMDIWLFLIVFLMLVFVFYVSELNRILKSPPFAESAVHAATWGTIGGILCGLWFLKDGVSERSYRTAYRILYFSIPFLGGLFGVLSYLFISDGLLTFGGTPSSDSAIAGLIGNGTENTLSQGNVTEDQVNENGQGRSDIRTLLFIPVAAIAGFNWEWFMMIFNRIPEIFFITKERSSEKIRV